MRFLLAILLLLTLPARAANVANVYFDLGSILHQSVSKASVTLIPTNAPYYTNGVIILKDSAQQTTDTNGITTFTNVAPLRYIVAIIGPKTPTTFLIDVPNTNATVNAGDITVTSTNLPSSLLTAYSQAASDARFINRTNGTGTNLLLGSVRVTGTAVLTNIATTFSGLGIDASAATAIDVPNRNLFNSGALLAYDWGMGQFYDLAAGNVLSLDHNARVAYGASGSAVFNWVNRLSANAPAFTNSTNIGSLTLPGQVPSTLAAYSSATNLTNIANGGANTLLHGTTPPAYSAVVEANFGFTDVTTANASASAHGLLPKLDNNAAHYLDGTGAYSTPAGGTSATNFYPDTTQFKVTLTDTNLHFATGASVTNLNLLSSNNVPPLVSTNAPAGAGFTMTGTNLTLWTNAAKALDIQAVNSGVTQIKQNGTNALLISNGVVRVFDPTGVNPMTTRAVIYASTAPTNGTGSVATDMSIVSTGTGTLVLKGGTLKAGTHVIIHFTGVFTNGSGGSRSVTFKAMANASTVASATSTATQTTAWWNNGGIDFVFNTVGSSGTVQAGAELDFASNVGIVMTPGAATAVDTTADITLNVLYQCANATPILIVLGCWAERIDPP